MIRGVITIVIVTFTVTVILSDSEGDSYSLILRCGSMRKPHTTQRRGHLRVAISTVSDASGSGRVDMLTGPIAAARAVVATGAWVKSKHMCLIRGSVGA